MTKEEKKEYKRKWHLDNKERLSKRSKEYYQNNKEKILGKTKEYYQQNKESKREYDKKYRKLNKEKIKEYKKNYSLKEENRERVNKNARERTKSDFRFKLIMNIRTSVSNAFRKQGLSKNKKLNKYGIDTQLIIEKLGTPPQDGKSYHIDHIFPVSAFDLNNPEHIRLCWHPDNLQWLESIKNIKKSDKYNKEKFEKYLNEHLCK